LVLVNTSEGERFDFGPGDGLVQGNVFVRNEGKNGGVVRRAGVFPLTEHRILEMVINLEGIFGILGCDAHFGDFRAGEGTRDAENLAEARAKVFVQGEDELEWVAALKEEGFLLGFFGFGLRLGVVVVGEGRKGK